MGTVGRRSGNGLCGVGGWGGGGEGGGGHRELGICQEPCCRVFRGGIHSQKRSLILYKVVFPTVNSVTGEGEQSVRRRWIAGKGGIRGKVAGVKEGDGMKGG